MVSCGVQLPEPEPLPSYLTTVTEETTNPSAEEEPVTSDGSTSGTTEPVTETISGLPLGELKVHFIDVGQGDSIFIDLGETEILIDGGSRSPGVVNYIRAYIDGPLEIMIATHPHVDHIGGLIQVLNEFEVKEIWHNGDEGSSNTYSQFISAVYSEGTQVNEARRGDIIQAGELVLNVLHPADLEGSFDNNSIVLSLSYGGVDFLFMGDTEKETETSMLTAGVVPEVEILKVGQHGSRLSSSIQFLSTVIPEYAIYMAKEGNSYGYPHQETIDALGEVRATIYGTGESGTIVVATNGSSYSVRHTRISQPETVSNHEVTN
ncbi:MAG: ComEC/Rec2 family competence protein, partial [Dehalococcoidales bacterium]